MRSLPFDSCWSLFAGLLCFSTSCSDGTKALSDANPQTSASAPPSGGVGPEAGLIADAGDAASPGSAPSASSTMFTPGCELGGPSDYSTARPTPLISVGKSVVANGEIKPAGLVDGKYHANGAVFGLPTEDEPAWAAIDVGEGPSRLLVGWVDGSNNEYNVPSYSPLAYELQTSLDSTDGEDGVWTTVVSVTDNSVRGRMHAIDFEGQRWLRFVVLAAQEEPAAKGVIIDEITIHDLSDVPEGEDDSWVFFGDSITKGAFQRDVAEASRFENYAQTLDDTRTPAYVNAGIGGETTDDALDRLELMLEVHRDVRHFAIAFGTNDSWGGQFSPTKFGNNLRDILDRVIEEGHVPVLARIPFANQNHSSLQNYETVIDDLRQEYQLPCGPDLYTWFGEHEDQLSSDGVHPNKDGYARINELWAEVAVGYATE